MLSKDDAKRNSLINKIGFLLASTTFPFISIFYYFNLKLYSLLLIPFFISYLSTKKLNDRGFFKISRFNIIITTCIGLLLYSCVLGKGAGVQLVFFGLVSIQCVIFDIKNKKLILLGVVITFLTMFVLELSDYSLFKTEVLPITLISVINFLMHLITVLIIAFSALFYYQNFHDINIELQKNIKELEQANTDIAEKTKLEIEYKIARQLQSQFLPSDFPKFPNFKIEHAHYPSQNVSGDFFDIHSFGKNKVGFLVLDVTGKGLGASFITVRLHSFFHTIIKANHSPKKVLSILNKEICKLNVKKKGCVCFYLDLNPETGEVRYSDSGLGVAFLLRNGELKGLRDEGGLILGAMDESVYTEGHLQLEKGDAVLIGSDGMTDVENSKGEKFGDDRLEVLLKEYKPESELSLKETLEKTLLTFSGNLDYPEDDLTFLTIEHL